MQTSGNDLIYSVDQDGFSGITKIELFSIMALQGILSNASFGRAGDTWGDFTRASVKIAKFLIEELNKK